MCLDFTRTTPCFHWFQLELRSVTWKVKPKTPLTRRAWRQIQQWRLYPDKAVIINERLGFFPIASQNNVESCLIPMTQQNKMNMFLENIETNHPHSGNSDEGAGQTLHFNKWLKPLLELTLCSFQWTTWLLLSRCIVLVNSCHVPNVVSVPAISPQAKFPATRTNNAGNEPRALKKRREFCKVRAIV